MNIDYDKVFKESKRLGISPHLLVKRKINYQEKLGRKPTCSQCRNYKVKDKTDYCEIIGYNKHDIHSEININYGCCDEIKRKKGAK